MATDGCMKHRHRGARNEAECASRRRSRATYASPFRKHTKSCGLVQHSGQRGTNTATSTPTMTTSRQGGPFVRSAESFSIKSILANVSLSCTYTKQHSSKESRSTRHWGQQNIQRLNTQTKILHPAAQGNDTSKTHFRHNRSSGHFSHPLPQQHAASSVSTEKKGKSRRSESI